MRILLATDGSRAADQARDLVAALPGREGGRVRIVSVAPTRTDLLGLPWTIDLPTAAEQLEDEALRPHREALEAAEREIRSARADLVIEPVLARGRAASVIVDEARTMPADLIVVGHRGHGRWESMLLGSISSEVVDHASCPVLVARDERLGPVVFADDGSTSARTAEGVFSRWPMFAGLPITVLTVAEEGFPYAAAVSPLLYSEAMAQYAESAEEAGRMYRDGERGGSRAPAGGWLHRPRPRPPGRCRPRDRPGGQRARGRPDRRRDPRADRPSPVGPGECRPERPAPRPVLGAGRARIDRAAAAGGGPGRDCDPGRHGRRGRLRRLTPVGEGGQAPDAGGSCAMTPQGGGSGDAHLVDCAIDDPPGAQAGCAGRRVCFGVAQRDQDVERVRVEGEADVGR